MDDEHAAAASAMRRSVELAEADDDQVGAAISRSVELWARYFHDPCEARLEEMFDEGLRSLELFRERQNSDPRAFRWVMNALAHLVNTAFILGDAARMHEHLRDLRANPWLREFGFETMLLQYEARYAMYEGRFEDAVREWEHFFSRQPVGHPDEAGAWKTLDHGVALAGCGRTDEAASVFHRGLSFSEKGANNAFWQARIREELAKLG